MSEPAEFDVVVLGSGAAGLTAAVRAASTGARVGLFEKADKVGGTTAWSGGTVWIPLNRKSLDAGVVDSREQVLGYLASLSHGLLIDETVESYIDNGHLMLDWLEATTCFRYEPVTGFPDYHPEHPGGLPEGGRSIECPLFPFVELGEWAARVTRGYQLDGTFRMTESSMARNRPDGGVSEDEFARRRIRDERGAGQAVVGHLLKAALDAGVEITTDARATRLVQGASGGVVGVVLQDAEGSEVEVLARGGVILATGGFEHDADLTRAFLRGPLLRTVAVPTNTGDGLRMAMRIGAGLGNMREAWWVPTIDVEVEGWGTVVWQVNGERSRPHTIMVNSDGRRFTDEAANYNAFGNAFHVVDVARFDYVNHPAWQIVDAHFLRTYGLAKHRDPENRRRGWPPRQRCATWPLSSTYRRMRWSRPSPGGMPMSRRATTRTSPAASV